MPAILNATQVPVNPCFSGVYNPATSGPLTSPVFSDGDTTSVRPDLNEAGGRSDLNGRFGGGGYAVVHGCALSAGSGLTLNIATGTAQINGTVIVGSGVTASLTNGGRNWIWLSQAGAITVVFNSTTPPAGAQALLGSALTSGGSISSVDTSGVLTLVGGFLMRETADTTTPGDTPPAQLRFFNKGNGKLWWWDGAAYWDMTSLTTPVSIANGGTGASTAAGARTNLAVMYEHQFAVAPGGNYSISATNALASQWEFQDAAGSPSSPWDLTVPSAANLISAGMVAGHAWIIRNDTLAPLKMVHTSGGADRFLPEQSQGWFFFDGSEIHEIAQNYPQYASLTGSPTFTYESQQMKALLDLDCGGTNRTLSLKVNSGSQRGRLLVARNDDASAAMLTVKSASADTDFDTVLIPGECQALVNQADGVFTHFRPYQRVVAVTHDDAASYTVPQETVLAYVLEVGGTLTAARNLVLPTVAHHMWVVINLTVGGFAITPKTSGGTGFSLANGEGAFCYSDGTNIYRIGAAAARA